MLRGQYLLMVVLQRKGLRFETRLNSRKGFLIKLLLSFQRLGMIGYLDLNLKREGILDHRTRSLLVLSVERVILVNV